MVINDKKTVDEIALELKVGQHVLDLVFGLPERMASEVLFRAFCLLEINRLNAAELAEEADELPAMFRTVTAQNLGMLNGSVERVGG